LITENLSTLKIHKLSKEQYNRELDAGRIDENALYLTPDEEISLTVDVGTNWNGNTAPYTQTVTATGITSKHIPDITPVYTGVVANDTNVIIAWESIYRITTNEGSITLYSYKPLTTAFKINIHCR